MSGESDGSLVAHVEQESRPPELGAEEHDLVARRFSADEWRDLLRRGVVTDASTLAAWALLTSGPLAEALP